MDWLRQLITNPYLLTGVSSWFAAQILKTIIYWVLNGRLDIGRLFGDGGMPSGHSATVTSLAVICALMDGADSFHFAISSILAIIVCHDAMGVRQETGKQAVIINELTKIVKDLSKNKIDETQLKEFVGHTPLQVLGGILVGAANGVLMYFVLT